MYEGEIDIFQNSKAFHGTNAFIEKTAMPEKGILSITAFTRTGCQLAERYARSIENSILAEQWQPVLYTVNQKHCEGLAGAWVLIEDGLQPWCERIFVMAHSEPVRHAILFIGSCGIAVRTIAPFLKAKTQDPAIVVADEAGQYLISLLSGHYGGANELTQALCLETGASPVITTASEVNHKTAVDVLAKKNNLHIGNISNLKKIAAAILSGDLVELFCEAEIEGRIPEEFMLISANQVKSKEKYAVQKRYRIFISPYLPFVFSPLTLHLIPKAIILGFGCRKGKTEESIQSFIFQLLEQHRLSIESIICIATIDLKEEEAGLLAFSEHYKIPLRFYSAQELNLVTGEFHSSMFVKEITGTDNISERAICCFDPEAALIQEHTARDGMTAALGKRKWTVRIE